MEVSYTENANIKNKNLLLPQSALLVHSKFSLAFGVTNMTANLSPVLVREDTHQGGCPAPECRTFKLTVIVSSPKEKTYTAKI